VDDQQKLAMKKSAWAVAESLARRVPVVSELIEGASAYKESIEEQQRAAFIEALVARVDRVQDEADKWYQSPEGETFVKKVVATALNAEYADKIDFLANALVNGPLLGSDDAMRLKLVEMIRQLSRPALQVLVTSLKLGGGQVDVAGLIPHLVGWKTACRCLHKRASRHGRLFGRYGVAARRAHRFPLYR
jgi:hypothetical protein